jgi:undecaprenyl-diphosphatase
LAWCIAVGTLPGALIGLLLEDFMEDMFARPHAAAVFLLVTALLLGIGERLGRGERELDALTWRDALLIGLAQAAAILPGISRSGATIAAGLALGLRRTSSARFSFLLATPITLAAGTFKLAELLRGGDLAAQAPVLVAGLMVAGLVGLGSIHFLMHFVHRRRLYPFAVYCAAIGIICLIVLLLRGG